MSAAIDHAFDRLRDYVIKEISTKTSESKYQDAYSYGYVVSFVSAFIRDLPPEYQEKFLDRVSLRVRKETAEDTLARLEKTIKAEMDALMPEIEIDRQNVVDISKLAR